MDGNEDCSRSHPPRQHEENRRVKVVYSKILMRPFRRSVGTMCRFIGRFVQVVVHAVSGISRIRAVHNEKMNNQVGTD